MARKDVLFSQIATNQSMATSYTSPVTTIRYGDNCAYQVDITTTNSTGTFSVQGSLNYKRQEPSDNVSNPGTWTTLNLSAVPSAAGANDVILISLNQLPFAAIRLVYTSSVAGTGTMNINVAAKQLGG